MATLSIMFDGSSDFGTVHQWNIDLLYSAFKIDEEESTSQLCMPKLCWKVKKLPSLRKAGLKYWHFKQSCRTRKKTEPRYDESHSPKEE